MSMNVMKESHITFEDARMTSEALIDCMAASVSAMLFQTQRVTVMAVSLSKPMVSESLASNAWNILTYHA